MFGQHFEHSMLRVPLELKFRQLLMTDDTIALINRTRNKYDEIKKDIQLALSVYGITSPNDVTHATVAAYHFIDKHPSCDHQGLAKLDKPGNVLPALKSILGDEEKRKHLVPQLAHYNGLQKELQNRTSAAAEASAAVITLMLAQQTAKSKNGEPYRN